MNKYIIQFWTGSEYDGGNSQFSVEGESKEKIQNEIFELAFDHRQKLERNQKELNELWNIYNSCNTAVKKDEVYDIIHSKLIIPSYFKYQNHQFAHYHFINSCDEFNCLIFSLEEFWQDNRA